MGFKIPEFTVGFSNLMDIIRCMDMQGASLPITSICTLIASYFKFYVLIKWGDMSKDSDLSKHGSSYEIFMHRAYGIHNPTKPEMQASVMLKLIMAEKTSRISEDLVTHYEDQLTLIKLYIGKAIDKYIDTPKITKSMVHTFIGYKTDLLSAMSTEEVLGIVYNINHVKAG